MLNSPPQTPIIRGLLFILVFAFFSTAFGNRWEDSILRVIPNLRDTSLVIAYNKLADFYSDSDHDKSNSYASKAMHLADSISFDRGRMDGRDNLGYILILTGHYDKAVAIYNEAISIAQQGKFIKKLPWLYNRLSAAYYYKGNYEDALSCYIKTADLAKKVNNKTTLLEAYNGVANIYMAKKDYVNTSRYYSEALVIAHDLKDMSSVALIENNLGIMYDSKGSFNEAMPHYQEALDIYKKAKDSSSIALTLLNIGLCNYSIGGYSNALQFYKEALDINMLRHDKGGLALCYANMATIYAQKKDFSPAIEYLNKSLQLANEIGSKEIKKKCYDSLSDIYSKMGQFKQAFGFFKQFAEIKDSLFNEMNTRSMNELQTKYETEKKESEIGRLNLQNEAQTARSKQKDTLIYFFVTGFILVLIIVFVVYRQYRLTQETNREIANQKLIVENQNKEITDSINYARQIQQAILPSSELIARALKNFFILYKPKAIVSGDFYFFAQSKECSILAAVDCTGHGVPGAFMSMIGHNLLTQIINEKGLSEPSEILNQLHRGVRNALQQDTEKSENRDGMDLALIAIRNDFSRIDFAGANRPLYLIRDSELTEIKGDKYPIGGLQYEQERKFTSHSVTLKPGDSVYIFSDGYADQFGGDKGKKFMVKNLQRALKDVFALNLPEQKQRLDATIEQWRGDHEQIDDILVIGVRV